MNRAVFNGDSQKVVDAVKWNRLLRVEKLERETIRGLALTLTGVA